MKGYSKREPTADVSTLGTVHPLALAFPLAVAPSGRHPTKTAPFEELIQQFPSKPPRFFAGNTPLTQVKMVAGKVAQSAARRWLGDAGTYPIIVTCAVATAVCSFHCVRYLAGHPDVAWNKEKRTDLFRHDEKYGEGWQSHRRWFATIHKNPVNESKGLM